MLDAIPVLGLLEEALLLPLAILLAVRMIPPPLTAELREEAARQAEKPVSRSGAAAVVLVRLGAAALLARAFW